MRWKTTLAALATAAFSVLTAPAGLRAELDGERLVNTSDVRKEPAMGGVRIRLAGTNGESVTATLEPGEAARSFRALLPLTLTLTDYSATEKISDLPRRLSLEGEPAGIDPRPGDLAYYAPWGNLAIFYKDFGYSSGLVRLGRLSRVPEAFRAAAPVVVTIEAAE